MFFTAKGARRGIDLRCELERAKITRGELLDVAVTGKVRIRGTPTNLKLTGTLDAVGGERLRAGVWGESEPRHPLDVAVTVRVKARGGRVTARVTFSKGQGRVVIKGRRRRGPEAAEKLLEQLEAETASEREAP